MRLLRFHHVAESIELLKFRTEPSISNELTLPV